MLKELMLAQKVWAVAGANANPEKFGYIIYQRLKTLGYMVYAVNPNYTEIEGDPCYPNLSALPVKPDVVDMVVSPSVGKPLIHEAAALGIPNVWFQPGTHDAALLSEAAGLGLKTVTGCVLVETEGKI